MKWLVILAAVLAALGLLLFQAQKPKPTRVTLLGDSLTVLMQQKAPLDAARRDIELVGITKEHTTAFAGFTSHNLTKLLETVPQPPTDVVLLMVGTNDILGGRQNRDEFAGLMNVVFSTWPNAKVFVAPVPASNGPAIPESVRTTWNLKAAKIAEYHHATVVPDLALTNADYDSDKIHFSKSGYEKMRARWVDAMRDGNVRRALSFRA